MEFGHLIMAALGGLMLYAYAEIALQVTGQTRAQRRARRRALRAELAAAEASDAEPAFSRQHVRAEIELMLGLVDRSWATGEDTLNGRRDERELKRWARWISDVHPNPRVRSLKRVRFLHVVNREGDVEDRVDAWVSVSVEPRSGWWIDRIIGIRTYDHRWTLGRRGEHWELLRFADNPFLTRTLKRPLIPMPWTDMQRLHGESLRELAAAEPAAVGVSGRYRDAAVRARDLSLVDARYSEPVIESVLLRLIEAWEQAALGRPQPLRRLATQRAGDSLRRKLAVDGLELLDWRIMFLDDRREPVHMIVDVDLSRGVEVRWVLESCDGSDPLWRLVGAS